MLAKSCEIIPSMNIPAKMKIKMDQKAIKELLENFSQEIEEVVKTKEKMMKFLEANNKNSYYDQDSYRMNIIMCAERPSLN
jgi:arsenate reductase-like glutaredoxin family protein